MIRKVNGFKVLSEKGKSLGGPYPSKGKAEKRLAQVEYFKHKGKGSKNVKGCFEDKASAARAL